MSEKNRIDYIDLAKGLCIILVLAVHIVPEIGKRYDLLTCLRMPLYFCLSGMFFKDYGGIKYLLIKKSNRLLLPFFGWYIISYGFYYFRLFSLGEASEYFHILDFFTRPYFYNIPLWFLLSLFWVNLLYGSIIKLSKNSLGQFPIILICTIMGWWMSIEKFPNWFFIGTALTCLPFFCLGRYISQSKIVISKEKKYDAAIIVLCITITGMCYFVSNEIVLMSYFNNTLEKGNILNFYLYSFSLVLIGLIACKYIKHLPLVSYFGRYSIIVLVTHELIRNVINRGIRLFINPELEDIYIKLIVMVIVIASMVIIIPFCRKFLPYICAQKDISIENWKTRFKVLTN